MEEKETRFDRSTERSECLIAEYKKRSAEKRRQRGHTVITGIGNLYT